MLGFVPGTTRQLAKLARLHAEHGCDLAQTSAGRVAVVRGPGGPWRLAACYAILDAGSDLVAAVTAAFQERLPRLLSRRRAARWALHLASTIASACTFPLYLQARRLVVTPHQILTPDWRLPTSVRLRDRRSSQSLL